MFKTRALGLRLQRTLSFPVRSCITEVPPAPTQYFTPPSTSTKPSPYEPVFEEEEHLPSYPLVNVRLQGYDFVILEKTHSIFHKLANQIGLTVGKAWAAPCQTKRVTVLKTRSTFVENDYVLMIYDRFLQLENVDAAIMPTMIDIFRSNLPETVTMIIKENENEDEENRFIPDLELQQLRNEMEEIRQDPKFKIL